jgi:hypothetical protein
MTWPVSVGTLNYRPVLSSERAPYSKNKTIVTKKRIRIKSGHGPQRGARYQDELVDWPSTVRWTQTQTQTRDIIQCRNSLVSLATDSFLIRIMPHGVTQSNMLVTQKSTRVSQNRIREPKRETSSRVGPERNTSEQPRNFIELRLKLRDFFKLLMSPLFLRYASVSMLRLTRIPNQ